MKSKIKIQLAREFRKAPTKSEKIMWDALRRNNFLGYYFRRQYVIGGYIVDFYCDSIKLVIEIDGSVHQKQIKEDHERQKIIEAKKIKFFRVSSREVENNISLVLENLEEFISPFPNPSPAHASREKGSPPSQPFPHSLCHGGKGSPLPDPPPLLSSRERGKNED